MKGCFRAGAGFVAVLVLAGALPGTFQAKEKEWTGVPDKTVTAGPGEPAPGGSGEEETAVQNPQRDADILAGDLVAFALQFVGGPYEYGGDSLTDGIDCSGFVHEVYQAFGYSVPRYSGDFLEAGEGIGTDPEKALPGDIVCYSGHVAIYIGEGEVVHASNSKPYPQGGIRTSPADYRDILDIRRIIGR